MEIREHCSGHKWEVLQKLYRRNANERKRYEDVVHLINSLYESLDFHQKENRRHIVTIAKLENELQDNADHSSTKLGGKSTANQRYSVLQEELANIHKQKGELMQQVTSLRSAVDEKENDLASKNTKIQELESQLNITEEQLKQVQQKLTETEQNLQLIKDEYEAMHITYSDMEEKIQKENQDLISRLIELKATHEHKSEEETGLFQRKKQDQLQKELEEASKKPVAFHIGSLKNMMCFDVIVPRKVQYKFDAHDGEVNAVAWTHSDFRFATAGGDCTVKLWDITSGEAISSVAVGSNSSVYSVDFDPEETLLLAASSDFASRVWSISDMKTKHTLTGHSKKVMSAKFLGEKWSVVSGSHDRTLRIWDLKRGTSIRTIKTGSGVSDVVTTDRNGSNLVSGHFDKKIRFWDRRSESSTNEIMLHGRITSLDLSTDGYLLCCVRDDCLKLIDFRMNKVVHTFSSDGFEIGCDWTRAKFSPDGQFCVCGSRFGCIYIWIVSTGSLKKVLSEHSNTVIACSWSWCGNYLLSCDKNKKAVLWSEF